MARFVGTEIGGMRLTEVDPDGKAIPGGFFYVTYCDIDSIEIENLQEDREDVDIPNANRDCRIRFVRPAKLHGKIIRIGTSGVVPEITHLLTGAPLNLDTDGDVIGYATTDYDCKYVQVEFWAKSYTQACATGEAPLRWRTAFKVGLWNITQDESYTNSNDPTVMVFEGVAEKSEGYDDIWGIWDDNPSYYDPSYYESSALLTVPIPNETDGLDIIPGGSSS